jgi:hypothetical protein
MGLDTTVPGSPDWLLDRHGRQILQQQARYDRLERYVSGDHPLPVGDQRYVKAMHELQRRARTNYVQLVTVAPVERMHVVGFRFGDSGEADRDAAKIWQASDMDYQAPLLHFSAATFGDAYVTVSPPDPQTGLPVLTVEDPRYFSCEMDPAKVNSPIAAVKLWQDDIAGRTFAVVMTADGFYTYAGPAITDQDLTVPGLTRRLFGLSASWELVSTEANPIGRIPVVRFPWVLSFRGKSFAEGEGVLDIQDRINQEVFNRLVISRAQAFRQRMIVGAKSPADKGRGKKPPFDPGADVLWVLDNPDAKMFEAKEADINQLLAAIRDDVGDIAAITKTPPHYLLGEVVNVSGDALKAAETGLVSKVKLRCRSMGWGWERAMRLAFAWMGDSRADDVTSEVLWADPEVKSRAELADALTKEVSAGVPLELAMRRAGFLPEEIAFTTAERRKAEAKALALAATQAAQTAAGGFETPGGGADAGPPPPEPQGGADDVPAGGAE